MGEQVEVEGGSWGARAEEGRLTAGRQWMLRAGLGWAEMGTPANASGSTFLFFAHSSESRRER